MLDLFVPLLNQSVELRGLLASDIRAVVARNAYEAGLSDAIENEVCPRHAANLAALQTVGIAMATLSSEQREDALDRLIRFPKLRHFGAPGAELARSTAALTASLLAQWCANPLRRTEIIKGLVTGFSALAHELEQAPTLAHVTLQPTFPLSSFNRFVEAIVFDVHRPKASVRAKIVEMSPEPTEDVLRLADQPSPDPQAGAAMPLHQLIEHFARNDDRTQSSRLRSAASHFIKAAGLMPHHDAGTLANIPVNSANDFYQLTLAIGSGWRSAAAKMECWTGRQIREQASSGGHAWAGKPWSPRALKMRVQHAKDFVDYARMTGFTVAHIDWSNAQAATGMAEPRT